MSNPIFKTGDVVVITEPKGNQYCGKMVVVETRPHPVYLAYIEDGVPNNITLPETFLTPVTVGGTDAGVSNSGS
jgi:hypothetical protein